MKPEMQRALVAAAGRYVRKLFGQIEPRIKAIEDRQADVPELIRREVADMPRPRDGTSVTLEDVEPLLRAMVEALPRAKDGEDGKSVTVDEVRPLVAAAVAELPKPQDGKSVTVEEVMPAITEQVRAEVAKIPTPQDGKSIDPEVVRAMVAEEVAKIPAPKDGDPGKSVTLADVEPLLVELVKSAVEAIPKPEKGEDGASVTLADVMPAITEQVRAEVAKIPVPKDGKDVDSEELDRRIRAAVEAIPAPKDGQSVDMDEVRSLVSTAVGELPVARDGKDADPEEITRQVAEAVAAIPKPRDGQDGPSADEVREMVAAAVADIPKPKDGKSVTIDELVAAISPRLEDRIEAAIAKAVLDVERRAQGVLERAIANIPKPKDGRDGMDLRHLSVQQNDDFRTITLTLKDDERTEHAHLTFPVVIDRGVFSEKGLASGGLYERGDGVTYGGSFWIAQVDGPEGMPGLSKDWRLAVKKGRDAKPTAKLPDPSATATVKLPNLRHVAPPERNPVPEHEAES